MADVQNFGAMRVVKETPGKTLGDVPGYLVTDASDSLKVHVTDQPPIVVSIPPVSVNLSVVSVTQGTSPWVVAGDVSTVVTIGAVSVTGHVSIDNVSTNPVQVTIQSFQTAVSVSGQVSVQNFPTAVSVTGQVSVIGPVSVTGHVSIDNASTNPVQVTVQSFQTAVSVSGQVSVQNFPTATSVTGLVSVTGEVSVKNPVSVTGQVSVLSTSTAPVFTVFASPQALASLAGNVSVVGNVSAAVTGNVSVSPAAGQVFAVSFASTQQIDMTDRTARVLGALTSLAGNVSVVGNVSAAVAGNVSAAVTGQVSTQTARIALAPAVPTHVSVGTVNVQAAASVAARKGLVLQNKTSINIYLGTNQTAVLGSGIFLAPNGTYEMDEYLFTTGSFGAIASAAGVACLTVQEL